MRRLTLIYVSTENILYSAARSSLEEFQRGTNDFVKKRVVQCGWGFYRGKHDDYATNKTC